MVVHAVISPFRGSLMQKTDEFEMSLGGVEWLCLTNKNGTKQEK